MSNGKSMAGRVGAIGVPDAGMSELLRRIGFLLLALLVFRVGAHIPIPGIDPIRLAALFEQNKGTILAMFNMFSGGALENMSIMALGVMPYISASIIMQLMAAVSPSLEQLKKEGESGRRKIAQYTRYLTVAIAVVQGWGLAAGMASQGVALSSTASFYFLAVVSLTTGTMFLMWLGEQITERGVGNGISMLIFAGIVAGIPSAIGMALESTRQGELSVFSLILVAVVAVAVVLVWYLWREGRGE
jgi:preprotein translocase subunit SecY